MEVRSSIIPPPHSHHPNRVGEWKTSYVCLKSVIVERENTEINSIDLQSIDRGEWKSDSRLTSSGFSPIWQSPAGSGQSQYCASLPSSAFNDNVFVVWNWSQWEHLHHGNWQMLQIRAVSPPCRELSSVQFLSHVRLFVTPMDCSTPGFPVHSQLPELAQTPVYWVGEAIQPPHPLLSPYPPAFNISQH